MGVDASNQASIASYFKHLRDKQEDVGIFQSRQEKLLMVYSRLLVDFEHYFDLSGFQYCCYNAFSHADLNVEIALNGKMKVYAIDPTGRR